MSNGLFFPAGKPIELWITCTTVLTIITVVKAYKRKLSASSVDDKCIIIFTIQCNAVLKAQAIKIVPKLFISIVLHVACLPRLPISV